MLCKKSKNVKFFSSQRDLPGSDLNLPAFQINNQRSENENSITLFTSSLISCLYILCYNVLINHFLPQKCNCLLWAFTNTPIAHRTPIPCNCLSVKQRKILRRTVLSTYPTTITVLMNIQLFSICSCFMIEPKPLSKQSNHMCQKRQPLFRIYLPFYI